MSIVGLLEESKDLGHFYVPQFEVKIDGVGLPQDILRDVTQLTYKDSIKEIDSFELTVNNWDSATKEFKYVGSETAASLLAGTSEALRYRLFEPCGKEVEVRMGYVGHLNVMLKGNFTTIEPNFPASGAPTLTVRGLNVLHRLRHEPKSRKPWTGKRDSQIVKSLERDFKIPIEIDTNALSKEPILQSLSQSNQHDIDFIFGRAKERGYVVFIQEAGAGVPGSKERLFFGPSQAKGIPGLRDVTYKLEWGKSLVDFKPTLSTANRVSSVTVRGWNRNTRRPIKETATLDDLAINRDLYRLLSCNEPRKEVVVNEPVFTEQQARARAKALLANSLKGLVQASATVVGLPNLRAGQRVLIVGLGSRFSGMYFITDTTHNIGDNGYTTRFNARREDEDQRSDT